MSKAIRKKMLWCSYEAQRANNGLNVNKDNRVWANRNKGHPFYDHGLKHHVLKPLNDRYWRSMSIWYNHINPLKSCTKPYSECSTIITKIILSKQCKWQSHQAQILITSQLSSYKINLYTHGKISDSPIRESTNPHIVSHPKIISHPSPCKINLELKLLTLYLVGSKRRCAKLEKLRMEISYNGVKGDVVQSSQWADVGQNKVNVWKWVRHYSDHKKMGQSQTPLVKSLILG